MMQNDFESKIHLYAIFLLLLITLFSSSCSTVRTEVSSELARQIALDAVGIKENSVNNFDIEELSTGYQVHFDDSSGNYEIGISFDGKVTSYNFRNFSEEENKNKDLDQDTDDLKELNEKGQENNSNNIETTIDKLSNEELISRMASFMGINQYDESDFNIESSSNDKTLITVQLVDGRVLFAEMNPVTGEILKTGNR